MVHNIFRWILTRLKGRELTQAIERHHQAADDLDEILREVLKR